ncbi:MAG: hypothetical protein BalsKO_21700 [Balneolaceae bacterium]
MKKVNLIVIVSLLFVGCAQEEIVEEIEITPQFDNAVAVIHSINGSNVSGVAYFEKVETGVHVRAQVTGLTGEKHGFHIHTFGNCTAEDGTSAGGHFNPRDTKHGSPELMDRHMGAMGNLEVNDEGVGIRDYIDKVIVLEEIIGRGIIVHGGEDDLVSQPSGASGPRVGCGVIGVAE